MKHKHFDIIMAWAECKQIQIYDDFSNEWIDWTIKSSPNWGETTKYRIKPETKLSPRTRGCQELKICPLRSIPSLN
jgi:hypothetical protein